MLHVLLALALPVLSAEFPVSDPLHEPAAEAIRFVATAADGGQMLAVWTVLDNNGWRIYASRVAADGTNLDPVPIVVETERGGPAAVAAGGGRYLVVYWRGDAVWGALLDRAGTLLRKVRLGSRASSSCWPRVHAAWTGTLFVAFFNGAGVALTREGELIGGELTIIHNCVLAAAPDGRGGTLLLTVPETRGLQVFVERFRVGAVERVGAIDVQEAFNFIFDGAIDVAGDAITVAWTETSARIQNRVAVATVGGRPAYFPARVGNPNVDLVRASGALLLGVEIDGGYSLAPAGDPPRRIVDADTAAAAMLGGLPYVVWSRGRIFGAFAADSAAPQPFDLRAVEQTAPRVAANGRETAVVWQEADGVRLAILRGGVRIAATRREGASADVAFDGRRYIAVRTAPDGTLRAELVRPDGTPEGEVTLPRYEGRLVSAPRIASGAGGTLIVFSSRENPVDGTARIEGVRLTADGRPLDAVPLVLTPAAADHRQPAIAAAGDAFLVASEIHERVEWRGQFGRAPLAIGFTLVAANGAVVDRGTHPRRGVRVEVAANEDEAVAIWSEWISGDPMPARVVSLPRLRTSLQVEERHEIAPGVFRGGAVAFNGEAFLAAWSHGPRDIHALRLRGAEITAPFTLVASPDWEEQPALAPGRVVYVREATEHPYGGAPRVFLREWGGPPHRRAVRK